MNDVDTDGNLLNYSGKLTSQPSNCAINAITFVLDISETAPIYPGFEFTIFFKNIPYDLIGDTYNNPFTTIGLVSYNENAPIPYIFSPPFPSFLGANIFSSVTLKSDGTAYNVVSSGPAGWLGFPAIQSILLVTCGNGL